MNSDTSEVDAVAGHAVGILNAPLLNLARKLERERDDARKTCIEIDMSHRKLEAERDQLRKELIELSATCRGYANIFEERNQLRKVCDWLADFVPDEKDQSGYNQLPHVKEKTK